MIISWKWVKKAIFNLKTLKLLGANMAILASSLLLYHPLEKLWENLNISNPYAAILQMVSIVFIDAIIDLLIAHTSRLYFNLLCLGIEKTCSRLLGFILKGDFVPFDFRRGVNSRQREKSIADFLRNGS